MRPIGVVRIDKVRDTRTAASHIVWVWNVNTYSDGESIRFNRALMNRKHSGVWIKQSTGSARRTSSRGP